MLATSFETFNDTPESSNNDEQVSKIYEEYESVEKQYLPDLLDILEKKRTEFPNEIEELNKIIRPFCFDKGALTPRSFTDPETGIEEHIEGIEIPNRASLLTLLERHKNEKNMEIIMFDVADFKKADNAGSADFLINKIFTELKEEIEVINEDQKSNENQEKKTGIVVPFRYGGDEFGYIAVNVSEEDMEIYKNSIMGRLELVEGVYQKDNGSIVKEEIGFKEIKGINVLEENLPEGKIFWNFVRNGLVLDKDEIKIIESLNINFNLEVGESEEEIKERVSRQHPKFSRIIELVDKVTAKDSIAEKDQVNTAVSEFFRGNVYDRLLNDYVADLNKFAEEHIQKPFQKIFAVDLPGLKEINDTYSYAHGDIAIKKLWREIKSAIGENRGDLRFYRRGNTIVICEVEGGTTLTEAQMENLKNMQPIGIWLESRNPEKSLDLQPQVFSLGKPKKCENNQEVSELLSNVVTATKIEWLKKQLIKNINNLDVFKKDGKKAGASFCTDSFFKCYLYSPKRKQGRLATGITAIESVLRAVDQGRNMWNLSETQIEGLKGLREHFEQNVREMVE